MEEINESGAAPEESKNQTGTGGIRKKAKHLARKTAEDWTARDVGTYASSIAFFFFMSMIPLLIIIFQLLPIFGLSQVDLIKFLDRLMPEAMQGFAAIVVSQAYRYSMGTLSLSVVTLVWSASKGTMSLRQGLNRVYGVEETRPYPVQVLLAIGYTASPLLSYRKGVFCSVLNILCLTFIYVTSMSNCQGEDDQFIVFDETDDSIVSYSISPLTGTIRC